MNSKRIEPADFGIDLSEILEQVRPHLEGTQQEIAAKAGIRQPYVAQILTGAREPNLATLAALAAASGGRLELKYYPPKKRAGRSS